MVRVLVVLCPHVSVTEILKEYAPNTSELDDTVTSPMIGNDK